MKKANHNRLNQNYVVQEGEDFLKNYKLGEELGSSNARVFEAFHKKNSTIAAIKEIRLSDDNAISNVKKEINLLKKIQEKDTNHYFIKFLNFCIIKEESDEYSSNSTAYILMEKGLRSLSEVLLSRKKNPHNFIYFSLEEVLRIIKHLIDAFAFLQRELNMAHCDIKPQNILMMKENDLEFKVCDVGAGELLMNDQHTRTKTIEGSIPFIAPELLAENLFSKKSYNPFKADVFSLGLCIIYIITFRTFTRIDRQSLNEEIFQETLNEWIDESYSIMKNDDLKVLLKEILIRDPKLRPDFKDLQEKILTMNLLSPTLSEFSKTNWTLNNEEMTNSFLVAEEMSPTKKKKEFLLKNSSDRNKSLHIMQKDLLTPNNAKNGIFSQIFPKDLTILKEIKSVYTEENSLIFSKTPNKTPQKSLSPVKVFKVVQKKMSIGDPDSSDVSPLSPEQRKGRKTDTTSNKNFSIQLIESKDSEEMKYREIIKKSNFSTKKIESPKKTHQKSNASEVVMSKNPLTNDNNMIKISEFFSNKEPYNVNNIMSNPFAIPTTHTINNHSLLANNGSSLSGLNKKNDFTRYKNESLVNLKSKKNNEQKKLAPLVLPENTFSKTHNFSVREVVAVRTNKSDQNNSKNSFFSEISPQKKNLIINMYTLKRLIKKHEYYSFENKLNLMFEEKLEEKEIINIFNEMNLLKNLTNLSFDLFFSDPIAISFIEFLQKNKELTKLTLNFKEKNNNESPLNHYRHSINSNPLKNRVNLENFTKDFNLALLNMKKLSELSLNFEKINDLNYFFVNIFKDFQKLENLSTFKITARFINLANENLYEIMQEFEKFEYLETLELFLENNSITEEFFQKKPINFLYLKKISLNFAFNKINLSNIKSFSFPMSSKLENISLDFDGNVIGNGLQYITSELIKLKLLKNLQLNFSDTKLNSSSFLEFSNEIVKINQLENLSLSLKGNNDLSENCIMNLGKIIRSQFDLIKFLELNFLDINISLNIFKCFLNFSNYMCFLKLEYFNLFLFRNTTQKNIMDLINTSNKGLKFESAIMYPDLKEMKIYMKFNREKRESFWEKNSKNGFCSFNESNSFATNQMAFSCLSCFDMKYFNDHAICTYCIKECHSNHRYFYLGEKQMICNCFLMGCCKNCFDEDMCTSKIIEGDRLQSIY